MPRPVGLVEVRDPELLEVTLVLEAPATAELTV